MPLEKYLLSVPPVYQLPTSLDQDGFKPAWKISIQIKGWNLTAKLLGISLVYPEIPAGTGDIHREADKAPPPGFLTD